MCYNIFSNYISQDSLSNEKIILDQLNHEFLISYIKFNNILVIY